MFKWFLNENIFIQKKQNMISLIPIFLIAPGLFAQQPIYDPLYHQCGTNSSSQFGCGPNLICSYMSSGYYSCLPSAALQASLGQACKENRNQCSLGSFCDKNDDDDENDDDDDDENDDDDSKCAACSSEFTSCESVKGKCCPGTTCTRVSAYVNGTIGPLKVCLKTGSFEKRAVKIVYSYSGCRPKL